MPEGHTLHRLAETLVEHFAGRRVEVSSPQGRFAEEAAALDGGFVEGAEAWGKHLFVEFEGERFVHVHLGLYGKLDVYDGAPPAPVGQVRMRLVTPWRDGGAAEPDEGARASYADLRGATACELVTDDRRAAIVERLGADPLRKDADPDAAWARISRSRTAIGALLMDQSVVAGVGNVYRAEVLFRHRIHPLRPGNTLRRGQFEGIWEDLVTLMAEGVATGRIDTVRPEHTPEAMGREPRRDDHGGEVYVYRRHDRPCHVCGAKVRTEVLAARNSFWCPRCQPKFRSRARSASL
ncbi:MAG TPA: DNA-formamidopyrimidine glycosylase family protein [Nocardioidaceae bacterium]|nr:DNA-formamidopyrimidine glycosylase family protein [Nocardioidaceae bacterium]